MKHLLTSLMLIVATVVTMSGQKLSRYELNVSDFSELKVVDGVNVDYKCNPDSAGMVVFYAQSDVATAMEFSTTKNRLTISVSDEFKGKNLPTVVVYSQFLSKAENVGDATLRVLSLNSGPKFVARLVGNGRLLVRNVNANDVDASINTGNGSLTIYGKCRTAKYNNTGAGTIQADDLVAEDVKCVQVGTGSVGCSAKTSLMVYGASGKVYYRGNPVIKNRSVGVGIEQIN